MKEKQQQNNLFTKNRRRIHFTEKVPMNGIHPSPEGKGLLANIDKIMEILSLNLSENDRQIDGFH